MAGEELKPMLNLALHLIRAQTLRLGRELHDSEKQWVVKAGFRVKYGEPMGDVLADKVLGVIEVSG